jgi:Domain of unknown function (DUF4190)/Domain of unknown function (DUF1707)
VTAGDDGAMRASDNDRWRVQSRLNDAFAEGRLTREEWDERATAVTSAATYADLARLTADLPVPDAPPSPPPVIARQRTSGLAIASLVCGICQIGFPVPTGLVAIFLGHAARRRIRRTGERGDGLALAGLILGYLGLVGYLLLFLVFLQFTSSGPPPFPPGGP